ncbi:hypothetical protein AGMMS49944_10430 [Spirochaetia bacterium]|nr:hypothetical protein AGMMS49944_10430 [Spirochaetia bacterium]
MKGSDSFDDAEWEFLKNVKSEIGDEDDFHEKQKYVEEGLAGKNTGLIQRIWEQVQLLAKYIASDETPWMEKIAPLLALVYLVSPIDVIPDFIPVAGLADDAAVILLTIKQMWEQLNAFSGGTLKEIDSSIFRDIADKFKNAWRKIKAETIEKELSYDEALKYFIAHKDDNKTIVKGAMIKEDLPDGYVSIVQIFLNKGNELVSDLSGRPFGRKLKVTSLNTELRNAFKKSDLVIVE